MSEDTECSYEHLKQTGLQICTDDFSGQFNFNFFLDISETSKRHWMVSIMVNTYNYLDIHLYNCNTMMLRAITILYNLLQIYNFNNSLLIIAQYQETEPLREKSGPGGSILMTSLF